MVFLTLTFPPFFLFLKAHLRSDFLLSSLQTFISMYTSSPTSVLYINFLQCFIKEEGWTNVCRWRKLTVLVWHIFLDQRRFTGNYCGFSGEEIKLDPRTTSAIMALIEKPFSKPANYSSVYLNGSCISLAKCLKLHTEKKFL